MSIVSGRHSTWQPYFDLQAKSNFVFVFLDRMNLIVVIVIFFSVVVVFFLFFYFFFIFSLAAALHN